jgi:hypothetical protein
MKAIFAFLSFGLVLTLAFGETAHSLPADSQVDKILSRLKLGTPNKVSDSRIASGLKEALRVGTSNAVAQTGRVDGYFTNEAIKILMPEQFMRVDRGLRAVGLGAKADEFVLSMNRAAEAAAPSARQIFVDAILEMSFDDARQILSGGDTAATDYFKRVTGERLRAAFGPVVEKSMNENGVTRQYNDLVALSQRVPFVKGPSLDITQYVVGKSLDGLFYMLAQEEKKIRKDPLARTTSLLKEVFGS